MIQVAYNQSGPRERSAASLIAQRVLRRPIILGVGGTFRARSTSERALDVALQAAERKGATVELMVGRALELPPYDPGEARRSQGADRLVDLLRRADGIIVSSAAYHGSVSGILKNAIDYAEDLSADTPPYLDGRAVGCIICAHGIQALGSTLANVRSIVHSLRGWNTPYAATINSLDQPFGPGADEVKDNVRAQIELVSAQVMQFATMRVALQAAGVGAA